ncbi:sugar-binding transcriptional regulator [Tabrizicola sp.]|uniref:sugar-binding transcriptional regulator n=1 Tax=Tabrizicola sp. TaxID=2005166 RepID=UPI0035B15C77
MTAGGKDTDDMVQATWLYHVGQMSQEEVSRRMGLSRFKVLRLLQDARDLGLVRISIEHGTTGTLARADRLIQHFGLTEAMVAPNTGDDAAAGRRGVGQLAASWLARIGREGPVTIGVGWGRTMAAMADALTGLRNPELCFVSLMGSMTHTSATSPFDVCVRLAALTGARAVFLPAPFLADSAEDAALIRRQRLVREALDVARAADHMVISVGECTADALLQSSGILTPDEAAGLIATGAVADTTGKFFAADGSLAATDLNLRAPSIELQDLHRSDVVVLSSGTGKAAALRAVLAAGFVNRLIVDEPLARALLQEEAA